MENDIRLFSKVEKCESRYIFSNISQLEFYQSITSNAFSPNIEKVFKSSKGLIQKFLQLSSSHTNWNAESAVPFKWV